MILRLLYDYKSGRCYTFPAFICIALDRGYILFHISFILNRDIYTIYVKKVVHILENKIECETVAEVTQLSVN